MNWCTKLQNSFFRVTELITWQTEKLGFHFIYISIYMFHLSVATTEKPQLITWNGINSKQCFFFFYLHCLSIIRLPNLSLIAHTHTHTRHCCDLPQCPCQSAPVVITLHPISWPWWLARAECSVCHSLQAGSDCDLLLYLTHTPCPTSDENTSEVKAPRALRLCFHYIPQSGRIW